MITLLYWLAGIVTVWFVGRQLDKAFPATTCGCH